MERTARCACGQLSAVCADEPLKVSLCHCLDCQRRTGAPFGIAAFFPTDQVHTKGESRAFERRADNGHGVTFHFCPVCGSTVYWRPARMPDRVAVAVGAFADPGFPPPSQEVFPASRHPWLGDMVSSAPSIAGPVI